MRHMRFVRYIKGFGAFVLCPAFKRRFCTVIGPDIIRGDTITCLLCRCISFSCPEMKRHPNRTPREKSFIRAYAHCGILDKVATTPRFPTQRTPHSLFDGSRSVCAQRCSTAIRAHPHHCHPLNSVTITETFHAHQSMVIRPRNAKRGMPVYPCSMRMPSHAPGIPTVSLKR